MAELRASRRLGTSRQLWTDSPRTDHDADGSFLVRGPARQAQGLAVELAASMQGADDVPWAAVERVGADCSRADFRARFRAASKPCVITGGTAAAKWPAGAARWSPGALVSSLGFECRLELAGADATVALGDFAAYLASAARDDHPPYVFETLVDGELCGLVDKFLVPPQCTTTGGIHAPGDKCDLLSAAGPDGLAFGLHRWLLIGGPNSGSGVHVDPLGTSAWNTSLFGDKLWVLFPPATPKAALGARLGENDVDDCAAAWFARALPPISAAVADGSWPHGAPVRLRQAAGETVFVPQGWWHAVLNLTVTVAVTQNFADPENYAAVAVAVYDEDGSAGRAKADDWRRAVADFWPDISAGGLFCVHCAALSEQTHPLLDLRPVCGNCEAALGVSGGEYERIGRANAEMRYALDLGADGPPPFPSDLGAAGPGRRGGRARNETYLLSQILEYAEDVHGSVDAARKTAARFA